MSAQTAVANETTNQAIDLNSMSFEELQAYLANVASVVNQKKLAIANELSGYKSNIEKVLRENPDFQNLTARGISFTVQIDGNNVSFKYSDTSKEKDSHESTPVAVKYTYTDKNGTVNNWTGRGLKPKWLRVLIEEKGKAKNFNYEKFMESLLVSNQTKAEETK